MCTAAADSILQKLAQLCSSISGTTESNVRLQKRDRFEDLVGRFRPDKGFRVLIVVTARGHVSYGTRGVLSSHHPELQRLHRPTVQEQENRAHA